MGTLFPLPSGYGEGGGSEIGVSRYLMFEILSGVLQLISVAFNGAIICTLCRRSLLKYPSNRFVFSLCLSHLFVSFLSITISVISAFIPSSPSGRVHLSSLDNSTVVCSSNGVDLAHLVLMHINFGVAVSTSITVALISAERYITIARPMRHKSIVTARRSLYAIISCWILSLLITMMPLVFFENRHPICGTFSLPMESLATYFGVVFAVVTVFALGVMIVCYTHIFRIAKAKCQKVQIGHFTASTVSSISSDWPSSAYSSVQGQNRYLHAGSRIESSNSLLHWVLMTNLGKHVQPLRVPNALRAAPLTPPGTPTLPPKNAFFSESALNSRRESDEATTSSRNGSTSSSNSGGTAPTISSYFLDSSRYHFPHTRPKLRHRWKTYLQPNYNSPRKTIFTIVLLIGSVLFTQLPLSFVLFTSTVDATQKWFQFCTTILFSSSSVANPVLYGFLNRSIRDQLWRLLKRKSRSDHGPSASSFRKRKRCHQQQQLEELQNSKSFLSSANHCHLQNLCSKSQAKALEIPTIKISRRESISSDDNSCTSTNSLNLGSDLGVKVKNQVQKLKPSSSSPYYRTVLLKKANSISKSNSILPRLALPDVNIRRNSSGSIISINGLVAKGKEEIDEKQMVEMKTFRNYSTPDLSQTEGEPNAKEVMEGCTVGGSNDNDLAENSKEFDVEVDQEENDMVQAEDNDIINDVINPSDDKSLQEGLIADKIEPEPEPGPSHSPKESKAECSHSPALPDEIRGVNDDMLPDNFPRKPSQDSGADMSFSEDEDEMQQPPPTPQELIDHCHQSHQLEAVILSASPGASVILKTGEDECEVEMETIPSNILLLPCSCPDSSNDSSGIINITITDSNSDTQLFNPDLFNDRISREKHIKSKSESDIATFNEGENDILKIRSNCHINFKGSKTFTLLTCKSCHSEVNLGKSPNWLSVMSVNSTCSELSSTCPLKMLEGRMSDLSDYDDFEDHIEI